MNTTTSNSPNKRDEKKQINIRWNSRLFFQIGVLASLLFVFFVMQTKFEKEVSEFRQPEPEGFQEPPVKEYVIELNTSKPSEPIKPKIVIAKPLPPVVANTTFDVKPNLSPETETTIPVTDLPISNRAPVVVVAKVDERSEPKNILNVEFVPVYPGCETFGTNAEKVACMSESINVFINKNFRREILEDLKANNTYSVYVNFKIDSRGYITEVRAISNSEQLKQEAQRVIKNLPTMKPGKQGDRNVDVVYSVPITFRIK